MLCPPASCGTLCAWQVGSSKLNVYCCALTSCPSLWEGSVSLVFLSTSASICMWSSTFVFVLNWCDVSINNWLAVWWYSIYSPFENKNDWCAKVLLDSSLSNFSDVTPLRPQCIVAPLIMMLFSCAPLSPTPLHYLGKFCSWRLQPCNQSSSNYKGLRRERF